MKYFYAFSMVLIIIVWLLLGKHDQEEQAFMDDLLLHQPIDIEEVEAMYWERKEIDINKNIIKAFNNYPANQIAVKNIDESEAELGFKLQEGIMIRLLYSDGNLFVKRNDVGEGEICYQLKETIEPVEDLFTNR